MTYTSTLLHNSVNLIIVKDILGHVNELTTLKYYIYNIENSTETEDKVLNSLESIDYESNAQSD